MDVQVRWYGGVDGVVVRPGQLLLRVATALGIKRVDVRHAAAEPDEDAVLGLSERHGRRCGCEARQRDIRWNDVRHTVLGGACRGVL